jgi:hypothetical protein
MNRSPGKGRVGSMRTELLTDSIDEQFHSPSQRANIDVEVLAIGEQLTKFP